MKLLFPLTLFLFIGFEAFTQLAIINDRDGFTNIRDGKSLNSKVVGQLHNDDIFVALYDQPDDEWWTVLHTTKNSYVQGICVQK